VTEVERNAPNLIGLSLSGEHAMDALSKLVVALHVCCPHARILVSGQDVKDSRALLTLMGVDAIAGDIDEAKEQMNGLWDSITAQ
jgi:hypothetical protein